MDKRKATAPTGGKVVGRKIAKTRQGHSTIFKNLSTPSPTQPTCPSRSISTAKKTTHSPPSSLAPDIHAKHALRIDSALSHYP